MPFGKGLNSMTTTVKRDPGYDANTNAYLTLSSGTIFPTIGNGWP